MDKSFSFAKAQRRNKNFNFAKALRRNKNFNFAKALRRNKNLRERYYSSLIGSHLPGLCPDHNHGYAILLAGFFAGIRFLRGLEEGGEGEAGGVVGRSVVGKDGEGCRMRLIRAFLMVDGGPVVDLMRTVTVALEELALQGEEPIGGTGRQDAYPGSGKNVVVPVTVVIHTHEADRAGDGISGDTDVVAIRDTHQLGTGENRGGVTGGERVASGGVGTHFTDGVFGGVGDDSHHEISGCPGEQTIDKVVSRGDFTEAEAEVKSRGEILDVVVEVKIMIAPHFGEIGAYSLLKALETVDTNRTGSDQDAGCDQLVGMERVTVRLDRELDIIRGEDGIGVGKGNRIGVLLLRGCGGCRGATQDERKD